MQQFEVELKVGDSLQIGNRVVTIVEIEGSELSVRIDDEDGLPDPLAEEAVSAVVQAAQSKAAT